MLNEELVKAIDSIVFVIISNSISQTMTKENLKALAGSITHETRNR
ncbi:MAG: hypothetical protein ACI9IL_000637 [Rickettsiales bacterium]|jgi:hypothetical protein